MAFLASATLIIAYLFVAAEKPMVMFFYRIVITIVVNFVFNFVFHIATTIVLPSIATQIQSPDLPPGSIITIDLDDLVRYLSLSFDDCRDLNVLFFTLLRGLLVLPFCISKDRG